jgi:C4-dicarboxylate-specific signal transduction histidine kinase
VKVASLHPREEERLRELARLEILDTGPESEYDEISQLACLICQSPIALISFIDRGRQWFKSAVGLNVKETSRDSAFCSYAILQKGVYEVPDVGKDQLFFDNPFVTGEPHIVHYAGSPILGPSGLPLGSLCVIDNKPRHLSNKQKRALRQLSNQVYHLLKLRLATLTAKQQKFQHDYSWFALQNMVDGVTIQDRLGYIVAYNPAVLKILALTKTQVIEGRAVMESGEYLREDGSTFPVNEHPSTKALSTGAGQYGVVMGLMIANGDIRWIRVSSQPIAIEGSAEPTHVVTTLTDVSEEKQKQAMIVQSAKLASLGPMAGGVAHEINTPLTTILLTSGLLRGDLRTGDYQLEVMEKRIEKIERATCRIESIVRGLTKFARDSSSDSVGPANLSSVINEGLAFFRERAKLRQVELDVQCDDQVSVSCVRHQVAQVIVNLVSNSFDAVDELDERWVKLFVDCDEHKAYITVTDSGPGISESIVDNMMIPFFTTKEVGKGIGLGLSISRGIIEDMGGSLYYRPLNGHTAFNIELPIVQTRKEGVRDVAC